jgi:competence protein ComEC
LRSDILIKGQHHSGESGSEAFLEAVRPRLIIATSRDFPEYERISDEWVEHVRAHGIELFRQDETGAVTMRFRRDGWEAQSYLTGEIFRSSSQ